ncbi:MAG: CoB--CoM heterodisulfide reductase iron-sulfur subunit B family protein [Desulfobacterales bacterium]|jgi:heterodisulfide reductase subunit B
MKFALFEGCNIPARLNQYADATHAVFHLLGIELVELTQFCCCGYPVRNIDQRAFILSAAKNLALAEAAGLNLMVMCKCCYGNLKKAEHALKMDQDLNKEINDALFKENLHYEGHVRIRHLLTILHDDVGLEALKSFVQKTYNGLQIAASYGCHALRPSKITGFDDPVAPSLFDELIEITGAYSVDWSRKLDCCGAPLTGVNDNLARDMALSKINSARQAGAHYLCTACPYSHLQFDWVQNEMAGPSEGWATVAAVLYPQLLGLSMGIDEKTLGLSANRLELGGITSYLIAE